MRSLCWSRLETGPVDPWREEPTLEEICWQDLWPPWETPVHYELQSVGGAPHCSRVKVWVLPFGGRSSRGNLWWIYCRPHSWPSVPLEREEVDKIRRKKVRTEVEPRKKDWVGQRCFKIWGFFSLSFSDLIGKKIKSSFPKSSLFCPWQQLVSDLSPLLSQWTFHCIFSPLSHQGREW